MIKNDKAWIGDLLGGPLMSRESRVIAELLLTDPDEQTWQEQIVGHNILQASSPNTAKRYAATIRLRLNTLDKSAWTLIAEGSERERQQLLFVALTLHSPVVKDFLAEVVNDLRRQFKESCLAIVGTNLLIARFVSIRYSPATQIHLLQKWETIW